MSSGVYSVRRIHGGERPRRRQVRGTEACAAQERRERSTNRYGEAVTAYGRRGNADRLVRAVHSMAQPASQAVPVAEREERATKATPGYEAAEDITVVIITCDSEPLTVQQALRKGRCEPPLGRFGGGTSPWWATGAGKNVCSPWFSRPRGLNSEAGGAHRPGGRRRRRGGGGRGSGRNIAGEKEIRHRPFLGGAGAEKSGRAGGCVWGYGDLTPPWCGAGVTRWSRRRGGQRGAGHVTTARPERRGGGRHLAGG